MPYLRCLAVLPAMLFAGGSLLAAQPSEPGRAPLDRPARQSAFSAHGMLLAVAGHSGEVLAVVGERGHVLTSSGLDREWRQASVPVAVTLTGIHAGTAAQMVAVGHGLTILRSGDDGRTWSKQTDGRQLARTFSDAAERARQARNQPLADKLLRLSREGADKPLLDVLMLDARTGLAVGAYGVALRTDDGGMSWSSACELFPGDEDRHINAIHLAGHQIWVAGERGLMYRSSDEGRSFEAVKTSTQAALFAIAGRGDTIVSVGLRGAVTISVDGGVNWNAVDTRSTYSFTAVLADPEAAGIFWAADDSGGLWRIDAAQLRARTGALRSRGPIAAFHVDAQRRVLAFGPLGLELLGTLPSVKN